MKAILYSSNGEKKSEIALPSLFETVIRDDLASKYFELEKTHQPYSHDPMAGRKHSASGTISHLRHDWKGHYGKGISRVPRKTMSRRGVQFFWVGAEVASTRGGRRVHGPVLYRTYRKMNKKEASLALNSAFAATAHKNLILKRYSSLKDVASAPAVIEELPAKTKLLFEALEKIYGSMFSLVLQNREVRAGRGKSRGRKYKSNAGLLIIKARDEKGTFSGLDVKSADKVEIADLYPLGRLTLYTRKAIEQLGGKK